MSQLVGGAAVGGCDALSASTRCCGGLWYDGEEPERLKWPTYNERSLKTRVCEQQAYFFFYLNAQTTDSGTKNEANKREHVIHKFLSLFYCSNS